MSKKPGRRRRLPGHKAWSEFTRYGERPTWLAEMATSTETATADEEREAAAGFPLCETQTRMVTMIASKISNNTSNKDNKTSNNNCIHSTWKHYC